MSTYARHSVVIGNTSRGRIIYANAAHAEHEGFSQKEHKEAEAVHKAILDKDAKLAELQRGVKYALWRPLQERAEAGRVVAQLKGKTEFHMQQAYRHAQRGD